jgi:hypothetical protein
MSLDELESKQRYNDYLREVQAEQLYQQAKAGQTKENVSSTQKLNKGLKLFLFLAVLAFGSYVGVGVMAQSGDSPNIEIEVGKDSSQVTTGAND